MPEFASAITSVTTFSRELAHVADTWWDRLDRLFATALTLPPDRRTAFLDRQCAEDAVMRGELTSLLRYASDEPLTCGSLAALVSGGAPSLDGLTREIDARVGGTLHHYSIEARLGAGGMGVVYRARDIRLDRLVALKFLSPALAAHASAKHRFVVEARAGAAIDHPNICTVYEIDEAEDGTPFIAMAYYEGETLREKLSRERLSIPHAVDYVAQAARGVGAAHACGIVHRDVKPGNIFLTRDGVAKLLDFGVAKLGNLELTTRRMALGTVGYMSPEQLRGEVVDARADIWSLGVVLFEALASHPPFRGRNAARIIYAALRDDPPSMRVARPDAPVELEAVARRAMAKDVANRHQTVDEFLHDLQLAAAGEYGRHA